MSGVIKPWTIFFVLSTEKRKNNIDFKFIVVMKKVMILFMGLIVGLGVMAQDNKQCKGGECDSQKVRLTVEQKARIITDRMVKAYGLTTEQGEKLYVLNAQKLKQQCRGRKSKGRCGADKQCSKKNDCNNNKGCGNDCSKSQAQPGKQGGCQVGGPVRYRAGLKEILTPEQFKDFCTDRAIERQLFGNVQKPKAPRGKCHRFNNQHRRGHNNACCGRDGGKKSCDNQKGCDIDKKECKKDSEKGREKQPKQKKSNK